MQKYINTLLCVIVILTFDKAFASITALRNGPETTEIMEFRVSGKVVDKKGNTPISGLQVKVLSTNKGTITDNQGQYSLQLSGGFYIIQYSFIGYLKQEIKIKLRKDTVLNVSMESQLIDIDEIVVRSDRNVSAMDMGIVSLMVEDINKLPSIAGETDIIKSMSLMPGVQTVSENSTGFNVRGSKTDQNLILVQDIPVYNTSHLLGTVSMLNADMVEDVILYKGSIPARYGGRISSIMDIKATNGNPQNLGFSAHAGPLNSKFFLSIPFVKQKISTALTGRISHVNWILKNIKDEDIRKSNTSFYDISFQTAYQPDNKNKVSLFSYLSEDNFGFGKGVDYSYRNILGSVHYKHGFSDNTFMNNHFTYSDYKMEIQDQKNMSNAYFLNTAIRSQSAKTYVSKLISDDYKLDVGFEGIWYQVAPGKISPSVEKSKIATYTIEEETALQSSVFAESRIKFSDKITLKAGLRQSIYHYIAHDNTTEFVYSGRLDESHVLDTTKYRKYAIVKRYSGFEPRVSLKYNISGSASFKAAYNKNIQYLQMVSNTAVMSPTDIWKLSDRYIKPLTGQQYSVGYFKNFNNNSIESSVEVYYKTMQNTIDYKNGASLVLNNAIEQDLLLGKGKAYGIEFFLRKNTRKLSGWIAYTWSRSKIRLHGKFPDEILNKGKYFPSSFDKPHDFSIVLNYKISQHVNLSADFVYSTGRPATFPEQKYDIDNLTIVYFSDRNKYRLPDYHRLNFSFQYTPKPKQNRKFASCWTFALYNLYGRNNAFSVFYKKEGPGMHNNLNSYAMYRLSVIGIPVPSITYQIRFNK